MCSTVYSSEFILSLHIWNIFCDSYHYSRYFRGKEPEIYSPRLRVLPKESTTRPASGIFKWIWQVYNVEDRALLLSVGLDGYVFLRFLRMCAIVGGCCSLFAGIVLIPIYFTAAGAEGVSGVELYSMGNIYAGGSRLWASFVAWYLFTGILLYMLHKEYENFVVARQLILKHGDPSVDLQVGYSVVVENIPLEYRSSLKLHTLFESFFPGKVQFAIVSIATDKLAKVVDDRKCLVAQLEGAIAAYENKHTRPSVKVKKGKPTFLCCGVTKVDAIDYYRAEIKKMDLRVQKLQGDVFTLENELKQGNLDLKAVVEDEIMSITNTENEIAKEKDPDTGGIKPKHISSTGFVTFTTREAQAVACQMPILSEAYPTLIVKAAPEPKNVIWGNIQSTPTYTNTVSIGTSVLFYSGLLFWGSLLAFISALSNLSNLEPLLPFLSALDPASYAIIQGLLPVIVLIIFLALIPVIITAIVAKIEMRKSHSEVQSEVFGWQVFL